MFDKPELQTVLWPAGPTIVVGLFVPAPGLFGVLAVLCGGAYLVAAFLEPRRLASVDR